MQAWLESVAPGYGPALMWTVFALIGLLILLVLIRIVRGLTFGTFVAGGRNRKTRLAVMDAAAVDSQRRLVLVRRDDVEHLILIGGPTDVVVERDIRLHAPTRRPGPQGPAEPAPLRPEQRRPAPQPAARPEQRQAVQSVPPLAKSPVPPANAAPVRMPSLAPAPQPNFSTPRPAPPAPTPPAPKPLDRPAGTIDLDAGKKKVSPELTLEDEMNRLLGELSNKR